MEYERLRNLLEEYKKAPNIFKATQYWKSYERDIKEAIKKVQKEEIKSGKESVFRSFGLGDVTRREKESKIDKFIKKALSKFLGVNVYKENPYGVKIKDIRDVAYRHCKLYGKHCNAKEIEEVSVSGFGNPSDIFQRNGNLYTMNFLSRYIRYCFFIKNADINKQDLIVSLGPGSGTQIELLKKMYPGVTILTFDLPTQIYLCETYLSEALGRDEVVMTDKTMSMESTKHFKKGRVYCFPNWKFPLVSECKVNTFWNAASFGEMEPEVVREYISHVGAEYIYLLQARHGKETEGKRSVGKPITFTDYKRMLSKYELIDQRDAWHAHRPLSDSGGYFEGVWKNKNSSL